MAKPAEPQSPPQSAAELPPAAEPNARRWRPSISVALTAGFGLLLLTAVGSVGWIVLDAGRQNTFSLLKQSAEITVDSIAAQLDQHLGAAARQAEYLAARVAEGAIEPADPERMVDMMLGALAATPQVNGIAFIDPELEALRVGRKDGMLIWRRSRSGPRSRRTTGAGAIRGRSRWTCASASTAASRWSATSAPRGGSTTP